MWRVWKPWRQEQYVSPKHVHLLLYDVPSSTPNLHSCHHDNHRFRGNADVLGAFISCLLTQSKTNDKIGSIGNIDYLVESERKKQLDDLLLSFNLTSIITFPTRIQNTSATAIDNMFLDPLRLKDHLVTPIYNGLSDHDAVTNNQNQSI